MQLKYFLFLWHFLFLHFAVQFSANMPTKKLNLPFSLITDTFEVERLQSFSSAHLLGCMFFVLALVALVFAGCFGLRYGGMPFVFMIIFLVYLCCCWYIYLDIFVGEFGGGRGHQLFFANTLLFMVIFLSALGTKYGALGMETE